MTKPMINGIKVKVGQKWKDGLNQVFEIDDICYESVLPIRSQHESWTLEGLYYSTTDTSTLDLVELIEDAAPVQEQPKAKARVVEETTNGVTNYMLEVLQENGDYVVIASSNNKETLIKEANTYSTIQCKVIHEVF